MFENVERLASFDPLTGIANHRKMQDFLARRVVEATRTGQQLGVIMLDVDHFRRFNEEEGHDAGDQVLRLVVRALQECIRPYDLAARYGGEEFTVILPGVGRELTVQVAERMRERIANIELPTPSGRKRSVTASFGCAVFPESSRDAAGLLKAADVALFRAKRNGRNRTCTFEGSYCEEGPALEPDFIRIESWLSKKDLAEAREALGLLEPVIYQVCHSLGLPSCQPGILRALVKVLPTYRRLRRLKDKRRLVAFEAAPEMQALLPSLKALAKRYDADGSAELPLLARVLAVLEEFRQGGGHFRTDPGRFDPEVVAALANLESAA
jgi:diguanylate cyclase (GGDEF)-like protein